MGCHSDGAHETGLLVCGGAHSFLRITGGLIGILGKTVGFSPFMTGIITVLAALYMVIMGFEMLVSRRSG